MKCVQNAWLRCGQSVEFLYVKPCGKHNNHWTSWGWCSAFLFKILHRKRAAVKLVSRNYSCLWVSARSNCALVLQCSAVLTRGFRQLWRLVRAVQEAWKPSVMKRWRNVQNERKLKWMALGHAVRRSTCWSPGDWTRLEGWDGVEQHCLYVVMNCMEQNATWEADSSSASQGLLLWWHLAPLSLFIGRLIPSSLTHSVSLRSTLILSSSLQVVLPSGLFLSGFPTANPITHPVPITLFYLSTQIVFRE